MKCIYNFKLIVLPQRSRGMHYKPTYNLGYCKCKVYYLYGKLVQANLRLQKYYISFA